ncbi:MAG: tetratricopeptide repeat protein, partial [Stackebrandtia sp.]
EHRLTELGVGNRRIATIFEMSYQELEERQRRMFRLCALNPAPDFAAAAAAALTGFDPDVTRELLDDLVDVHLLNPAGRDRYTFHDLLRIFGKEKAHLEDGDQNCRRAVDRLFEWIARSARAAAIIRRPKRQSLPVTVDHPEIAPTVFADRPAALDWFATEEQSLSCVVHGARQHRRPGIACQVIDAMRGYFFHRVDRLKWRSLAEVGLAIAREQDDPVAEAAMCHSLGLAATLQGEYPSGIALYEHGVALTRRSGDEQRRVELLLGLAGAQSQTGAHHATAECAQEAIELTRQHDDLMLSGALHMIGVTCWESGDLEQGARHLQEAVALDRHLGEDTLDDILSTLSIVYTDLGMLNSAYGCAAESLSLGEGMGSVHSQASALQNLAGVHLERGHFAQAETAATRALKLAIDSNLDKHVAFSSLNLGLARLESDPEQARDLLASCQATARDLNMGMTQIESLIGLSRAYRRLGDKANTLHYAAKAVDVAEHTGLPLAEAKARTVLAAAQLEHDDLSSAEETANRALDRHVASGHLLGAARTRLVLSRIRSRQGRLEEAETLHAAAARIYQQVGTPFPLLADRSTHG